MKRNMIFAALGILPLLAVLLTPLRAEAWNASYLRWITHDQPLSVIDTDEGFYNYDFQSYTGAQNGDSTNCDWPVTILFTDDGYIPDVKSAFWGETSHSHMYNKCMSNNNQSVDSDSGSRSGPDWWPYARHMRLYAQNGLYHYNPYIYLYSVATTHIDSWDYSVGLMCGWSEDAEEYILDYAQGLGYTVYSDCYLLWNPEFFRTEQSTFELHVWDSNGWGSRVVMWP